MDDLRDSLSRFKKDIKRRLGRDERKVGDLGPEGREEGVGSSSSFPRPGPPPSTGDGSEREGDGPNSGNKNVGGSVAADENGQDWKTTASSSAKLILRGVRDSADAFGPLKSVAGGLCFILENCDVRCIPLWAIGDAYVSAANKGKQTGDRVVSTPGQRARRTAL